MEEEKNLTEETTEDMEETTEAEEDTEASENIPKEDDENKILVAVYPILFHSHQYKVGDILPANYPDMVEAWLEAGTAVWKKAELESHLPMARPMTAEPGLAGASTSSESANGDNLVGKVPRTVGRKKK